MKWGGKRGVIGRGRGKIKDLHLIFVLRRGLLREHELDEIARLRWRGLPRLDQRMIGRGHGYDVDAPNVDAAKSHHIHVQLAAHADAGMAAPDRALDAARGLHEKTNRTVGNCAWKSRSTIPDYKPPVLRLKTVSRFIACWLSLQSNQ